MRFATIRFLCLTAIALAHAYAQVAGIPKQPLNVESYAIWNSIRGAELSPDGQTLAYSVAPGLGDGQLVVRDVATGREFRHSRGFIGRQQLAPGELSNPRFPDARFTPDGRRVLFTIEPAKSEVDQANSASSAGTTPRRFNLGLMDVRSGSVEVLSAVERFQVPSQSNCCIVYTQVADSREVSLKVRDLSSDKAYPIASTSEFILDNAGKTLVYSVQSSARDAGVFVRRIPDGEASRVYATAAAPAAW